MIHVDAIRPDQTEGVVRVFLPFHQDEFGVAVRLEPARPAGHHRKFLAAHRFYEKHGFARLPREELPPSLPVMVVDSIFHRLVITI